MLNPARRALKPRGVYRLPFLTSADEVVLVAVNRRGQRVAERAVARECDVARETAELEALLARVDRAPLLRAI